jgi:Ca2+-transporting ATPase
LLVEIPFFFFLFYHELADITHARTETFFLFIIIELIIVLNFRSMRYSIFKLAPHKWLVLSILSQIVLTIILIQIPSIREGFEINKPSFSDLEIMLVITRILLDAKNSLCSFFAFTTGAFPHSAHF